MTKSRKYISICLIFFIISNINSFENMEGAGLDKTVQIKYRLVAENVISISSDASFSNSPLHISQKDKSVRQIDLLEKRKKKFNKLKIYYRNKLIAKNANGFFPTSSGNQIFIHNKKNDILFTARQGQAKCFSMFNHKTEKDCERDDGVYYNDRVLRNISKCWGGVNMFSYVQNNNLVITGFAAVKITPLDRYCPAENPRLVVFKGKADQVEQVVSVISGAIFVLMKDGSVWGRGNNTWKLISDSSEEDYYDEFVEIVPSDVKSIAVVNKNTGILKNDGTLWLWGERKEKGNNYYSAEPYMIAKNVKEFAMGLSTSGELSLLFIKKNDTAYGWGSNKGYAFTSKYKGGWLDKPVKLKSNIKHVYAGKNTSFLLDKKNRLYWAGTQYRPRLLGDE